MPGPDLVDVSRTADGITLQFKLNVTIPLFGKGGGA